jgi:hypothetical protein
MFSKVCRDIRKSSCTTGTTGVVDTSGKFATSVNDTSGKFAAGFNGIGGK